MLNSEQVMSLKTNMDIPKYLNLFKIGRCISYVIAKSNEFMSGLYSIFFTILNQPDAMKNEEQLKELMLARSQMKIDNHWITVYKPDEINYA